MDTSTAKRSGKCVLCGGRPLSREHVWPRWIAALIKSQGGPVHIRSSGGADYDTTQLDLTVRRVCRECNHGWMERMESEVRPFLTPMMTTTDSVTLSVEDQFALARWYTKTMLMHDLTHSTPRIPQDRYTEFFAEPRPFDDSVIWLGAYGGNRWPAFSDVTGTLVEYGTGEIAERHVAALTALNVFLQSFLEAGAVWRAEDSRRGLWRIWPARDEPITFPRDGFAMTDEHVLAVTEQLRDRLRDRLQDRFSQP